MARANRDFTFLEVELTGKGSAAIVENGDFEICQKKGDLLDVYFRRHDGFLFCL